MPGEENPEGKGSFNVCSLGQPNLLFGGANNSGCGRVRGDFGMHTVANVKTIMITVALQRMRKI